MPSAALLRTSLDVLYYTGASQVLRGIFGGRGAIFMLHHVFPGGGRQAGFAPNSSLEVTPEFLDDVITLVKDLGFDLVSLDEAVTRIEGDRGAPFAVFTLDDGYHDNLVHARPVFRRHHCPFIVYVTPAIADGSTEVWWRGLEAVIAGATRLSGEVAGDTFDLPAVTDTEKQAAWDRLYWPVRLMPQHEQRAWIKDFCDKHGIDLHAMCRAAAMDWDEIRQLADDPLCTIGAHSINHFALADLSEDEALAEMVGSADRIDWELGERPRHFAYPYGDAGSAGPRDFALAAKAGFATAVTTRKGLVFGGHRDHLMALPRVSLSGNYQRLRYVDVLLSGTAFALLNGFRRLNVA
jgi:peptidoglycan/xylan/chitin deacetylase (PgdA/CDA1 family)